jgi:hypothetical protein
MHHQHSLIATTCPRRPHHSRPCLTLTPIHCEFMQCRLHHPLHQNWMYNHLSWPNHCLRSQMHKDGPLDDPSLQRYKPSTSRLPTYHCHSSQRQCHFLCRQVCPLCQSTPLFSTGHPTTTCPQQKYRTENHSRPHVIVNSLPPAQVHSNGHRPYAAPVL